MGDPAGRTSGGALRKWCWHVACRNWPRAANFVFALARGCLQCPLDCASQVFGHSSDPEGHAQAQVALWHTHKVQSAVAQPAVCLPANGGVKRPRKADLYNRHPPRLGHCKQNSSCGLSSNMYGSNCCRCAPSASNTQPAVTK